jgi:hypothetical protein
MQSIEITKAFEKGRHSLADMDFEGGGCRSAGLVRYIEKTESAGEITVCKIKER